MSAPTRQFHRLSIGHNMPETRSSTRGRPDHSDESEREDSSVGESEVDSEEEESSDDEPAGKTILARSGITYDMKNLDDETGANASVGLRSQFEVVNCRASDSGYDFQLLDRPQVHVGSDSTTCTCSTFQSRPQAACQHIFVSLFTHPKAAFYSAEGMLTSTPGSGFLTSFMPISILHPRQPEQSSPATVALKCVLAPRNSSLASDWKQ